MSNIILASVLGTALYIIMQVLVVFGGAMFFTWLVVLCIRKWFKVPPPTDTKRQHEKTNRPSALVELRLQVENTRLQTEQLRLEQERLRAEREAKGE